MRGRGFGRRQGTKGSNIKVRGDGEIIYIAVDIVCVKPAEKREMLKPFDRVVSGNLISGPHVWRKVLCDDSRTSLLYIVTKLPNSIHCVLGINCHRELSKDSRKVQSNDP